MHYTDFKTKENFRTNLGLANKKLLNIVSNTTIALTENLQTLKKDSYHFLINILSPNSRVEKTLHSCLASSMKKSEMMSAKSGYLSFLFSISLIKTLLKNNNLLKINDKEFSELFNDSLENFRRSISKNCEQISEQDFYSSINNICESSILANVIKEAISLGGLEGKIRVEDSKHQSSNFVLELKTGHCFNLKPYEGFLDDGVWESLNVKVLPIDGFIESVSELNTILNRSKDTKNPMLILAHGFSEEVIATLKTNKEHGIFNILPVKTYSGIESLNVINDVAIVTGTDIVSCVKGEQIRFINYDNIPIVSKIRCLPQELIMENSKINPNINAHIKTLLKKREDNISIEDICNLLDKRIKSLFTHSVVVTLPNISSVEKDSTRIKFDIALRACKTLLTHGVVNIDNVINDLQKSSKTDIDNILIQCLLEIKPHLESSIVPTLSLFLGVYFSVKTVLLLLSSSGFVEIQEN